MASAFASCPHCLEKDGERADVHGKGNSKFETEPVASSLFKGIGSSQDAQRDKPAGQTLSSNLGIQTPGPG